MSDTEQYSEQEEADASQLSCTMELAKYAVRRLLLQVYYLLVIELLTLVTVTKSSLK